MAFPTDWTRKCELTFASTPTADLAALFTEGNLPSEMFDADGDNPALNGGGDIRFSSDSAGTSQLPCEVVSFVTDNDPANGTAQVWVKVPAAASVWVWYGKNGETQPAADSTYGRNAVWSNYLRVHHLEEEPVGTEGEVIDSAGNWDASFEGASGTESESAKVGNGLTLNGTSQAVNSRPILTAENSWEVPGSHTNTGLTWNSTQSRLAFVDWDNGEIVETNLTGTEQTSINIGNGADLFQGLAHDSSDDTYWVCAYADNEIQHFGRTGTEIAADAFAVTQPNAVAYSSATDELFVMRGSSGEESKVYVYDAANGTLDRTITLTWPGTGTPQPDHIALRASDSTMWITYNDDKIRVYRQYNTNGSFLGELDPDEAWIEGLCFDSNGKLRVCFDAEYHGSVANGNRVFQYDVSDVGSLSETVDGLTLRAWVTNDTSSGTDAVMSMGEPIRGTGVGLYKLTASGEYRIYASAVGVQNLATRTPGTGQKLFHLSYDPVADTLTLYANGAAVGSGLSTATLSGQMETFRLYAGTDSEDRFFDCHLDELRVYDGPMTAAMIADEYETENDPSAFATAGTPEDHTDGSIVPLIMQQMAG